MFYLPKVDCGSHGENKIFEMQFKKHSIQIASYKFALTKMKNFKTIQKL